MVLARIGGSRSIDNEPAQDVNNHKASPPDESSSSTKNTNDSHLFPRQRVLLQQTARANSNRFNDGSRRSFAGDAVSFRRSDSDRSVASIGSSMRSVKGQEAAATRPRKKKHNNLVQKVRTSARYLLKKKTAKFAATASLEQVRYIETIDEYTATDLERLWFSVEDLDDAKAEAEDLASLWEEHPALAQKGAADNPYRGLEDKTPNGFWDAYKARRDVLNAVLDVQDEQQAADPAALAAASVNITAAFAKPAVERAKQDVKDAAEHCQTGTQGVGCVA